MSLAKQVDKYARSSYSTDNVDAILKEYGLNLQTELSQLDRGRHVDDGTDATKGEKMCRQLVDIVEKQMFRAADLDNLSEAKRLKGIRTGISDALDKTIFHSKTKSSKY